MKSERRPWLRSWLAISVALLLLLCSFVVLLVMFNLLFPSQANRQEQVRFETESPMAAVKQIALGLAMYAADYDEHLPLAEGWEDATMPYVKDSQLFAADGLGTTNKKFAFLDVLSGVDLSLVQRPESVPVLFQSKLIAKNAHGGLDQLDWFDGRTCAVGFLDGHAERKPDSWRLEPVVIELKK